MKLPVLALSALLLIPAHSAAAQRHGTHIEINDDDHGSSPARPGPRHDLRDACFAMTTTDDVASLLLTRRVVALQLTERAWPTSAARWTTTTMATAASSAGWSPRW